MSSYCYFNGKIIPETKANISLRDLGVLRGFAVFDVLRTYNGKPFMLKEHFARLKNSAAVLDLKLPISANEFEARIFQLLKKNKLKGAVIRTLLTGGVTSDGINGKAGPTFFILTEKLPKLPKKFFDEGIKIVTQNYLRELPLAKTTNYINTVLAQKRIKREKAFEVLYTWNEKVLECSTSNFFIFKNNVLITPKNNILIGITRNFVISLAKEKFKIEERAINFSELQEADETFITATNKEIMPVVLVDDLAIGGGKVGSNTRFLMDRFSRFVKSY